MQTTAAILAIALVGSLTLSVNAIRCHQCNSHLDEDCNTLRLSTPHGDRDNQYLRECEGEQGAGQFFCRKMVTHIQVNGESRIVRACGWDRSDLPQNNRSCTTADHQGYQHIICNCFTEGCNSAPLSISCKSFLIYGLALLSTITLVVFRRNQ